MWFGGGKGNRRKSARGRDAGDVRSLLRSNTRVGESRRGRWTRLQGVVLALLILVACVLLGWLLTMGVGGALFWNNPRFALRKIEIHCDGPMITPGHVREYTGLHEGMNLFAMNVARMRADFLDKTPHARDITFVRHLPDRLEVDVSERETLARLGRWGFLGVDEEGRVYSLRSGPKELPALTGFAQTRLTPGAQVDSNVMRGIEVLATCRRSALGNTIRIASIDVAPADHIELYLTGGERVRLAWTGMGSGTGASHTQLEERLKQLVLALESAQLRGKHIASLDLTFDAQYMPAQEY